MYEMPETSEKRSLSKKNKKNLNFCLLIEINIKMNLLGDY